MPVYCGIEYRAEVSNRFAALEDLDAEVEINYASKTIIENIKISAKYGLGYYELEKRKPWFEEGYTKLLDQNKPKCCGSGIQAFHEGKKGGGIYEIQTTQD
jgi:hypothetical protein